MTTSHAMCVRTGGNGARRTARVAGRRFAAHRGGAHPDDVASIARSLADALAAMLRDERSERGR